MRHESTAEIVVDQHLLILALFPICLSCTCASNVNSNASAANAMKARETLSTYDALDAHLSPKKPPPPGGFPIYYVPTSRNVSERTPLEAPGTNSSRGVLLLTVLDEGT